MAAPNTEPVFTRVADVQWIGSITAANTNADLTGAGTSYLAFTADATNGGYVTRARIKTAPGANCAATVVRFWLNNGSTVGTAANSALIGELTFAATTASSTAAQIDYDFPLGIALPPGYRIYVTVGTAPGGTAALTVTCFGGKY
jgi:hypothetical protein